MEERKKEDYKKIMKKWKCSNVVSKEKKVHFRSEILMTP